MKQWPQPLLAEPRRPKRLNPLPRWPIPLTSPLQQQSAFTRFFGNEKEIHNLI